MTDSLSDNKCSMPKCLGNKRSIAVLAVLAGTTSLWFIWFGSASLISKEMVEGSLKRLSTQVSEFAEAHGKKANLTYGEVEITGWGYNKKAVVHTPVFELAAKNALGGKNWSAATNYVTVEGDSVSAQRVILLVSQPVNVSQDGKLKDVVTFAEPLKYTYTQLQAGGKSSRQDIFIPKQITVAQTPACAEGAPDCAPQTNEPTKGQTIISFATAPTLQILSSVEKNERVVAYSFSGLEALSGDGSKFDIGSATGKFNKEDGDGEGKFTAGYELTLNDIVASDSNHSSKPYAFNADVAVAGEIVPTSEPAPPTGDVTAPQALTPPANIPTSTVNKKITVNEIAFSGADFKLHATGDFLVESGDPLPSGLMNFQIDNLQQFLNSEIVPAEMRGTVTDLLEKITGQLVDKQEALSIPIKREKNGVLYIGNATFEALTAKLLSDVLMGHQTSAAAPIAPTPAPALANPASSDPVVNVPPTAVAPSVTVPSTSMPSEGAK